MGAGDGNVSMNANSSMHVSGRSNEGKMEGIQEERGSGGVDRDGNKMMMPPPPPPPPVWNGHPQQVQSTAFYSKADPQNAVGSNTTNVPVPFSPYNGYQPATSIYPVRSASMPVSFVQVRPVPRVPVFGTGDRPVGQGNLDFPSHRHSRWVLCHITIMVGHRPSTSTVKPAVGPQFNVPNPQGKFRYQNAGKPIRTLFPPPRVQGQSHNTSQHNAVHAAPSTHSNIHAPTQSTIQPSPTPATIQTTQPPNPPPPSDSHPPPLSHQGTHSTPKSARPSLTSPTSHHSHRPNASAPPTPQPACQSSQQTSPLSGNRPSPATRPVSQQRCFTGPV